jgi:hypothetical protein
MSPTCTALGTNQRDGTGAVVGWGNGDSTGELISGANSICQGPQVGCQSDGMVKSPRHPHCVYAVIMRPLNLKFALAIFLWVIPTHAE